MCILLCQITPVAECLQCNDTQNQHDQDQEEFNRGDILDKITYSSSLRQ